MKLYELTHAYAHINNLLDDDAVSSDDALAALDGIDGALKEKAASTAMLIGNLESMAAAIKAAEEKMAMRRKTIEGRAKAIRNYILMNMVNSGINKIECEYFSISVKNNPPSVIVEDEKLIPAEYMRVPEPPPPAQDKRKILADMKEGVVIEGVRMEQGKSLLIR